MFAKKQSYYLMDASKVSHSGFQVNVSIEKNEPEALQVWLALIC